MARVYKARQLSPQRLVAVKVIDRGLAGDGESVVHDLHHLERGYEDLPDKLRRLGAEVEVEVWSEADHPSYDAL